MKEKNSVEKKGKSVFAIIGIVILCIVGLFFLLMFIAVFGLIGAIISGGASGSTHNYGYGNVAVIPIDGVISTGSDSGLFSEHYSTSSKIVDLLDSANRDDSIKAVVLEINSPGGSGVASEEIAQQVNSMNKPVISVIREVGASGAYWVASASDYIFASRMSTVGSIGVIASSLNFAGFIDDHNITYTRFVAGDQKDFGTPYRDVTEAERARFQSQLDELHSIFIEEVAKGRQLDPAYVRTLADGFIFTGTGALKARLIDEIGNMNDAADYLDSNYNISTKYVYYIDEPNFFEALSSFSSKSFFMIGQGIGQTFLPDTKSSVVIRT